MNKYLAQDVYYSFRLYQHFLHDNNLQDDSDQITVKDLMEFVKNQITDEYKENKEAFIKEAY